MLLGGHPHLLLRGGVQPPGQLAQDLVGPPPGSGDEEDVPEAVLVHPVAGGDRRAGGLGRVVHARLLPARVLRREPAALADPRVAGQGLQRVAGAEAQPQGVGRPLQLLEVAEWPRVRHGLGPRREWQIARNCRTAASRGRASSSATPLTAVTSPGPGRTRTAAPARRRGGSSPR